MASLRIIAANGGLTLPIGWTLPIVVDSAGRCVVHRANVTNTFPFADIAGLATERRVTLLGHVDFDPDVHASPAESLEFDSSVFPDSVYILYRDPSAFERIGIEISRSISAAHRSVSVMLPDSDGRFLDIFVVTRPTLIYALNDTCYFLNDRISDLLKALDWDEPVTNSAVHDPLVACTKSYYDVAFNQQQAIRAITLRGLLLVKGNNSHMLSEWLEAACKRWHIADWSIETWRRRFDSVAEQTTRSVAFTAFHQDAICREAIRLVSRLTGQEGINENASNQMKTLLQIHETVSQAIPKEHIANREAST